MGDIADMMLDGTLCQGCGVYLHGKSDGEPRCCRDCKKSWLPTITEKPKKLAVKKTKCPLCSRLVKIAGLADHTRVVHPHGAGNAQ